jgi:hypothetical protein
MGMLSTNVPIIGGWLDANLVHRQSSAATMAPPFPPVNASTYAVTSSIAGRHMRRTINRKIRAKFAAFEISQPCVSTVPVASCAEGRHCMALGDVTSKSDHRELRADLLPPIGHTLDRFSCSSLCVALCNTLAVSR